MPLYAMNTVILNERPFTLVPDEWKIAASLSHNHLHTLSGQAVITVDGDNAITFLQGQLSADIRLVNAERAQPAALCSLKGRILALMTVLEWEGRLHLVLPADNAETVLNTLSRVAALSRVKLLSATDISVFGCVVNTGIEPALPLSSTASPYSVAAQDGIIACALGAGDFLVLARGESAHQLCEPFSASNTLLGSLSWHHRQLLQGRFSIYPHSTDVFLPHRLGLHKGPHLAFDKGCYRGQEVIARMHYKSTVQHHLQRFVCTPLAPLLAGQRLLDKESAKEWGEVVDTCPDGASDSVLVVASMREGFPHELRAENHTEPFTLSATSV
ncbi:hypothetical protein E3226_000860 [Legionella geestiana]|nr:hypothetical protein E3226_000860 [Legionella geestiana]